jgi:hypothetical protein
MDEPTFACLLQRFFLERLVGQRNASRHTVSSYRDTFRLLLAYAGGRTGKPPSSLAIGDLNERMILGFLDHIEADREQHRIEQERAPRCHTLVLPLLLLFRPRFPGRHSKGPCHTHKENRAA